MKASNGSQESEEQACLPTKSRSLSSLSPRGREILWRWRTEGDADSQLAQPAC